MTIAWLSITCGGFGGSTAAGNQHVETDLRSLAARRTRRVWTALSSGLFADQHLGYPGRTLRCRSTWRPSGAGGRSRGTGREIRPSPSPSRDTAQRCSCRRPAPPRRSRPRCRSRSTLKYLMWARSSPKISASLGGSSRVADRPNPGIAVAPGSPEPRRATGRRTPPRDRSAREAGGRGAAARMPPPRPTSNPSTAPEDGVAQDLR